MTLLVGCTGPSLRDDLIRDPVSLALPPAETGPLFDLANAQWQEHGPEYSGFHLLDGSKEALDWRLVLIDSAVSSLDIQTYLWYPDHSGRLILDRAIHAADRGVSVRLLIDDLLTIGLDQTLLELQQHPNIEFRIFNPWGKRGLLNRGSEALVELERLNIRMHDKLIIADGNAAIVGGRNLGDYYFGLHKKYNFHDLDVLGFGHIARQSNDMFDHFWNSDWVVSVKNLELEPDADYAGQQLEKMRKKIATADELQQFARQPRDWSKELAQLGQALHAGTSQLFFDETDQGAIRQKVAQWLFPLLDMADEELLITNAYIIPGELGIDFVRRKTDEGVKVKILTNSLESHDVPAVNSHYKAWRDDFILAGAELFEARANPAIQSTVVEVPPTQADFVGLHTKAFVVDRELSFIGSMNFDPRSSFINTEVGALIKSPGLSAQLAELMERDMAPENAWQVRLDEDGRLYWEHADKRVERQPARSFGQRIMDLIFKLFPKELF